MRSCSHSCAANPIDAERPQPPSAGESGLEKFDGQRSVAPQIPGGSLRCRHVVAIASQVVDRHGGSVEMNAGRCRRVSRAEWLRAFLQPILNRLDDGDVLEIVSSKASVVFRRGQSRSA